MQDCFKEAFRRLRRDRISWLCFCVGSVVWWCWRYLLASRFILPEVGGEMKTSTQHVLYLLADWGGLWQVLPPAKQGFDMSECIVHFVNGGQRKDAEIAFPESFCVAFICGFEQTKIIHFFLDSSLIEATDNGIWLLLSNVFIQLQEAIDLATNLLNRNSRIL